MKVGITGGIATGKSTVLAMLAEMGYSVASADEVAREVFAEVDVQARLASLLGREAPVHSEDLREALFRTPELRRQVNRIFHPAVMARLAEVNADFTEVPLLFEVCAQEMFCAVWVVTCAPEVQRARILARYGEEAPVEAILASQLPLSVKEAFSHQIIRTDGPPEHVRSLLSFALPPSGRF